MTPEQIGLIRESFEKVVPIQEAAAAMFYDRLFELEPSVKPMFKHDMAEQGKKLMDTLDVVIENLDNLEIILPGVRSLGRRHAGYGVEPRHYDIVASALLWTLERGLGEAFTPETRKAWATAYGLLASTMIEASEKSAA